MAMRTILFVCTANLCRSPMAEVLFQEQLREAGLDEAWRVESAGTWAQEGFPASKNAQLALNKRGLDLSQHRSRVVTEGMLRAAGLVLVMERGHKEALRVEFPALAHKVFLLSEIAGGPAEDIHDPFGSALEEYEASAEDIAGRLCAGFENILRTAESLAEEGLPREA
ncbi:MAG TPA: low molecular weight protein arginine phosphatase [Anaerolineaceae bacterium]|nr:low molecular weight protein arginine phosphatase [Anaerolineaceae bacterium]